MSSTARVVKRQKVVLDGTETWRSLRELGLADSTARGALKRGYYYEGHYLKGGIREIPEGPGHFAKFKDPYSFTRKWVVCAMREMASVHWHWYNLDDYVQTALTELWESRHIKAEVYLQVAAKIILRKVRRVISREMTRVDKESKLMADFLREESINIPEEYHHGDVTITRFEKDGNVTITIHSTRKQGA